MSDRKTAQVAEGQVKGAMTRLKELSPELRVQVIETCEKHTYKGAEPLVEQLVGFACSSNVLCRFRKWQLAQEELVLGNDRVLQVMEFLKVQMPGVSAEKLKEMGVMFFTLMALARDDAKAFVNVTRTEIQNKREQLREKKLELDERKFKQSLVSKMDAGLNGLEKTFRENPVAAEYFVKARKALRDGGKAEHPTTNIERRTSKETGSETLPLLAGGTPVVGTSNIEHPTTNIQWDGPTA